MIDLLYFIAYLQVAVEGLENAEYVITVEAGSAIFKRAYSSGIAECGSECALVHLYF